MLCIYSSLPVDSRMWVSFQVLEVLELSPQEQPPGASVCAQGKVTGVGALHVT